MQVNKERQENGLSQLPVHVVPMVPANDDNQDGDNKLSSTSLRRQMLCILLKPPLVNYFLCLYYFICLLFINDHRNQLNQIDRI
jgi:hypothetical protein